MAFGRVTGDSATSSNHGKRGLPPIPRRVSRHRGKPLSDWFCAYCDLERADSLDHVPPKSLFSGALPDDMVRVPACGPCHSRWSVSDEKFRVLLSLYVGIDTPANREFWKAKSLRTVAHNDQLHREILDNMREVDIVSPGGLYLGKGSAVPWDAKDHDQMIERFVRGLYFHHFETALGMGVNIDVYFQPSSHPVIQEALELCRTASIGGKQFVYAYARAQEENLASLWLFKLRERHVVMAVSQPFKPMQVE